MATDPTPIELGVDLAPTATAIAQALAGFFKAADTIISAVNTPAMIAARQSAEVQAELSKMDADLVAARKSGDFSQVDKDSSG